MPLQHRGNVTPAVFAEVHTHMGENDNQPGAFRVTDGNLAMKMTEDTNVTYIAQAAIGSSESSAVWQCMKIDETSGMTITWADGDERFNNIATDLTALTYS